MTHSIFNKTFFSIASIEVNGIIVLTWFLMGILAIFSFLATRSLSQESSLFQTLLEGIIITIENAIEAILPGKTTLVFPFIATLWIFILISNLIGLIPGLSSPTADLSVTASLAVVVFFSVHWFGIRAKGLKNYLKHYLSPNPIMLPFHLISEVSRTIALAVRLFGNVMSLEIAAILILMVAGPLVPIPLLMLHIVEAFIQAYLFGMLTLIYIASSIQSQENRIQKEEI